MLILDEKLLSVAERAVFERLIEAHPVTFFDSFTMIDLRSTTPRRAVLRVPAGSACRPPTAGSSRTSIRRWRWCARAYLPGECEALRLGVAVATDETVDEPTDPRLLPCYHDLLVDRGQDEQARTVAKELGKSLPTLAGRLGSARIVAAGMRQAKLEVEIAPAGPAEGELRYQLSRDGKVGALLSPSLSVPRPKHWKSGHLHIDHVELPPGRWDVELQLIDSRPAPAPEVLASVPLGAFVR